MMEILLNNGYFFLLLTLVAFSIGSLIQKKTKLAILNPLLLGAAMVIAVLWVLDIPNSAYQAGCQVLNYLLTPATICLAVGFYEQFQNLKKQMGAMVLGLILGTVCCIGSVYILSRLFRLDRVLTLSLLPKIITTAIGVPVSQEIGGIAAITSAVIALTGILTNMLGPYLCRLFRITDPVAQGVSFGTAGHVIGTAKASEISQICGAVSSFSLTCTGIFTTILLSFVAQYI